MNDAFTFDRPMRFWQARTGYLKEHYKNFDGVRLRPTGEPPQTVPTASGPLVFKTSAMVRGLDCHVDDAVGNAAVGNAIDELLTLRYSRKLTTDTAEGGRSRVRQVASLSGPSFPLPEGEDSTWTHFRRTLKGWLKELRRDTIDDTSTPIGLARVGMVLGLHAAVDRKPELCVMPERRHSRLVTADLEELLQMADPPELKAVGGMLSLATRSLPAPSQVTRSITQPRCGHGSADLLLDGTLIEVKSGRDTSANSVLTAEVIHQLLGYVLSVTPRLEESGPVTRAGWYLARYGVLWDFPIEEIPSLVCGRPLSLEAAREAFTHGVPPAE